MPSQIHKTWLGRAGRVKVEFHGDGHTTKYSFPFPYKQKNHVIVELYDANRLKWIKQNEGGSYTFVNDNTIEFNFAPKPIPDGTPGVLTGTKQPKIRIRRCTLSCGTELTHKFEPIADPDSNNACRGETDGSDGLLVDDRDDPLRPFKVGDTITYTSSCIQGANVSWYKTPRTGGSATLFNSIELRGQDKDTSVTVDDSLIDHKLSVRVKCIGCGPPDGLCCEFKGSNPKFEDTPVLRFATCGVSAVIGGTSIATLHDVHVGNGVISLTATSPPAGQTFDCTFPNGNTSTHTVNANTPTEFIIPKPTDSGYVTIETGTASSAWQYSLRCTSAVDPSQYEYARWVGSGEISYSAYTHGGTFGDPIRTTPASTESRGPWTTGWYKYNDFSANKIDGFLMINDPQVCETNGWNIGVIHSGPYFRDTGIGNNHLKEAKPWQASYTVTDLPSTIQSWGFGNPGTHVGTLSVNGIGLCGEPGFTFRPRQEECSASISGYWEFSNDTGTDKNVDSRWDGVDYQ